MIAENNASGPSILFAESKKNDVFLSSFSKRFFALILDGIIVAIPTAIIGSAIPIIGAGIVWLFYFPVFESSRLGATLGKLIVGIKVLDAEGKRLTFQKAFLRNVIKIVSGLFCGLGFLLALFTKGKQSLHDILAQTYVVREISRVDSVVDAWVDSTKECLMALKAGFDSQFSGSSSSSAESRTKSTDESQKTSTQLSEKLNQIERLAALYVQGALTDEEFRVAKIKILETL